MSVRLQRENVLSITNYFKIMLVSYISFFTNYVLLISVVFCFDCVGKMSTTIHDRRNDDNLIIIIKLF